MPSHVKTPFRRLMDKKLAEQIFGYVELSVDDPTSQHLTYPETAALEISNVGMSGCPTINAHGRITSSLNRLSGGADLHSRNGAVHDWSEKLDLLHQFTEAFRQQGLRPIRQRVLRLVVNFDNQAIRTDGDCGPAHRSDLVAFSGAVAGID